MTQRITICGGCGDGGGAALAGRLGRAMARDPVLAGAATVATAECLNVCAAPVSVAFRAPGKAAYLFAGVAAAGQEDELLAFARLYHAAPDGTIADARPCGRLRHLLIGRIPAG